MSLNLEALDDDGPLYVAAKKVVPQKVWGTYRRLKWSALWVCLGIYYFLPFVRWHRGPNEPTQAVLADMAHSRFYFFFIELWPQEIYYFTGLLILASLALFLSNALFGRVWCGYFCPQTVWTDLFLWVERLVEGDRRDRLKLDAAPWTADKIAKRVAKHGLWLILAWWTGGAWVLYFADAPTLVKSLLTLQAPFVAYVWIAIFTATTYALAGHMREQVCLYMCPWPRIQAALTDADALNVMYRRDRGEPRLSVKDAAKAKAHGEPAGDCVDCRQCVNVCPTGVDIRQGAQLGCVQCGLCIDACDAVMTKLNRPIRLIAYDTDENMARRKAGKPSVYRLVRPRTALYVAVMAVVGGIMLYTLAGRGHLGLSVLHARSPLYTVTEDGGVRNAYTLRLSNKWGEPRVFTVAASGYERLRLKSDVGTSRGDASLSVRLDPDSTFEAPVSVAIPAGATGPKSGPVEFTITDVETGERLAVPDHFFAP